MDVLCDLLHPEGDWIALRSATAIPALWTQRLQWACRDRRLDLQVLFSEPLALPSSEPSEPVVGALARMHHALQGTGAMLILRNPAEAFGRSRMAFADGVRLVGIGSEEDEACWDVALTLARPLYGVRGTIRCQVLQPHPASVLSALAYGVFTCEEGLALRTLSEDRGGVSWDSGRPDAVSNVIIRDGFEVASIPGACGSWTDSGQEGYVRVVIRAGDDACWTQPRFVAPRGTAPAAEPR